VDHRCSGDEPVEPTTAWVRRLWDDLAPHATGGDVRERARREGSVRDAYAGEVFDRLVAVKRRYDPDGVLSGNGIA
jgi:FAD/FMN-containing dehydrogenase